MIRGRLPRVYLAGKMKLDHDWRGSCSPLEREHRLGVMDTDVLGDPSTAWFANRREAMLNETLIEYVGPFPSACDHGCAHSSGSLHMVETCNEVEQGDIVAACVGTIETCDVLCAHFNTIDCYGTLIEVGLARGLGKLVSVTVADALAVALKRPGLYDDGDDVQLGTHDLWFACRIAHAWANVPNDHMARVVHGGFIDRHWR